MSTERHSSPTLKTSGFSAYPQDKSQEQKTWEALDPASNPPTPTTPAVSEPSEREIVAAEHCHNQARSVVAGGTTGCHCRKCVVRDAETIAEYTRAADGDGKSYPAQWWKGEAVKFKAIAELNTATAQNLLTEKQSAEAEVSRLRETLRCVLNSATPNPRDNPMMFYEWHRAQEVLKVTP